MKNTLLLAVLLVSGLVLSIASETIAGCCFCWDDCGGQSTCDEDVTEAQCIASCEAGGWDRYWYIDEAVCWCDDIYPYSHHDGLDWRYVVVVTGCQVVDGECKEMHQLWTCGVPG